MARVILHIDLNAFFASCEEIKNPDLKEFPVAVGSTSKRGVISTANYEARKYGVHSAMPVYEALRVCPDLVLIQGDYGYYRSMSAQFFAYLKTFTHQIEPASIDECYMDYSPIAAQYSSPEAAAAYIRDSVREKFHFTVNVGISDRKVLAKMASDFQKPDKTHTLYQEEIPEKMWPLPVSTLFTCGHSSAETLRKLGILTIGDLAKTDPVILESHLKSHGRSLWKYANGIDDSVVALVPSKAKGIGNSTTLSSDALTEEDARKVLLSLCESVGQRLRSSHQLAGQVCTEIRYSDFRNVSHQMPLTVPTASPDLLLESAVSLFGELWDGTPIRLLGVRTSKLVPEDEPVQLSLFDYTTPRSEKQQKLDAALDDIRAKYGKDAVKRGSFV